ncbi:hypothetical protein [Streptomyces sp. NPDC057877]|uniref:hypothetical protein n=1 Tax=Streptomyces sp. NPDC057877 TaxID=3346269 RepID=UPI0036A50943
MSKFVYRNENTGDVVEYDYRSPRLEMLPNWVTLQDPEAEAEPEPPHASPASETSQEQPVTPPVAEPVEPEPPVVVEPVGLKGPQGPEGTGAGGDGSGADAAPERPARSAPKADWVDYARARAQDSDEEATIDGLTKEQLIEQYGGDS